MKKKKKEEKQSYIETNNRQTMREAKQKSMTQMEYQKGKKNNKIYIYIYAQFEV